MPSEWLHALLGGALIGLAVSIMLLFNGRVTGICGIYNGILSPKKGDTLWRVTFVVGLLLGGSVLQVLSPGAFAGQLSISNMFVVMAGLLVGFGTAMGSGCTSGHGICGISRLSIRSMISTLLFISAGVATVAILRLMGGTV